MRKGRRGRALIFMAAMAGLGIVTRTTQAQFAWDPQQTPLVPSGGSGTWDNTILNWSNGASDVVWNSTTANFGGPGGAVMIGAPVTAAGINLNADGYTFSSSSPSNILSLAGTLTQAAGVSGINELAGPVNFSNSTVNINGGTLKLSNTMSSEANSITNTTFNVDSGSTLEFSAVTGAGALGNGSIVLNGGTLQIDPTANGVVGSYNSHFISTGQSNTTNVDYYAKSISGSPSILSGPINFNPNFAPPSPFYTGGPVNSFAARFTGAIDIATPGQYTFSTTSDDGSRLFIDNKLVVMNDGTKTAFSLSGAPITLSAGLHEFRLDYAQSNGSDELNLNYSGPDTGNSMTLVPTSAMQTLDPISLTNNISVSGNSTINLAGNNFTQAGIGQLTFNVALGGSATLNINGDPGRSLQLSGIFLAGTDTLNTTATVFAGELDSGQTPTLIKTGTGTLIFDDTATSGTAGSDTTIDIQQGTVEIIDGYTTSTGSYDPIRTASLKIDGGTLEYDSKLALDGAYEPDRITITSAGGMLETAEPMAAVFAGPLQLNGNLTIATASGNATSIGSSIRLSGALTGSGNIEKVPSTFTGDISNQGTLVFAASSPNWTGSITLDDNAGSIEGDFNSVTDKPFGQNAITLHGGAMTFVRYGGPSGVTYTPGNDVNADGDFALNTGRAFDQPNTYFQLGNLKLTGARTVTQSGDMTTGVLFTGTTLGGDTTFNVASSFVLGPISESAPSSLTKTGVGALPVSSASYSGATSIQQGTIQIGSNNALPATALNIAQGTLDLNGHDQSVASLRSTNPPLLPTIVAGSVTNSGSGLSTLSILGNSNFSGSISDGGSGKAIALNIVGGTSSLSGPNNYSGGTVIHSGAMLISQSPVTGSAIGTGAVTLAGGTLWLNGQEQAVATLPGLSAQFYYIVPNQTNTTSGTINANFNTLTSFTSH
ncbi:MAG TPA: PA14 domain-containing protein, partial [Tepidisphaeraceae bacterium]|nr:PA14 domain-containing protein [Tepidisphaeraceae bacterium]